MIIIEQAKRLAQQVADWRAQGLSIGFVPTMGNLHEGHLSLVKLAQQYADRVVVSVFVNPLQFGAGEDYGRYPRTLQQDQHQLEQIGCDVLFAPSVEEVYPHGDVSTRVQACPKLSALWEGKTRPGHFDGVCTVVAKLFNMVQADLAVFGQKDYQQWRVIETMVADLNWPLALYKAPIARASDGLALSSRNQYLTASQRRIAPKFYEVLKQLAVSVQQGQRDFESLLNQSRAQLIAEGFDQVDYIQIVERSSLLPATDTTQPLLILATVRLGHTRLLDNIEVEL